MKIQFFNLQHIFFFCHQTPLFSKQRIHEFTMVFAGCFSPPGLREATTGNMSAFAGCFSPPGLREATTGNMSAFEGYARSRNKIFTKRGLETWPKHCSQSRRRHIKFFTFCKRNGKTQDLFPRLVVSMEHYLKQCNILPFC